MERIRIVRNPQEVKPLIQNLKEVLVSEVTENTSLNNAYIHGDIVGHSTYDDGSSLLLTIQGDARLQFTTVIRGEAANQYPDASTGGTIYLYGGTVDKSEPEWSQASGFQLVIDDSSETNVILLHKNAKDPKRSGRRQVVEFSVAPSTVTEPSAMTGPPITTTTTPPTTTTIATATISPATAAITLPLPGAVKHSSLHTSRDEVEMALSKDYEGNVGIEGEESEGEGGDGKEGGEEEGGGAPRRGNILPTTSRQEIVPFPASKQRHRKRDASEMDEGDDEVRAAPQKQRRRAFTGTDSTSDEGEGSNVRSIAGRKSTPVPAQLQWKRLSEAESTSRREAALMTNVSNNQSAGPKTTSSAGYRYTRIAQLKAGDDKVNVFGVVKFFKPIVQSKGTDFCSVLSIVDESAPVEGLKCVIFNRSQDKLPHIQAVGDIICIHRLTIQTYKDELQAKGCIFTSSICFDGKPNAKIVPRTGSQMYTLTDDDYRRVKEIREWAGQHAELNPETRARQLCRVNGGDYFDLTCQVVSKSIFTSQDFTILSVWDGTRFPLERKQYDYSYSENVSDPALSAAAGDLAVAVVLYDNHSSQARAIKPGHFVRLSNVHAVLLKGYSFVCNQQLYAELCIHRGTQYGSGAVILPGSDEGVVRLKSQLDSLVGGEAEAASPLQRRGVWSQSPLPRSATVIPHARVSFTPIRDVLAHSTVPFKFHCRARVECVFPACLEDLVQLRCSRCARKVPMPRTSLADSSALVGTPCPTCCVDGRRDPPTSTPEAVLHMIYVFKMVLEDESGHLSAYVAEGDAAIFLPGLPPTNLYVDQESRQKLLSRLYYLTGGNDPFVEHPTGSRGQYPPRPWMECCLKSYHHGSSKKVNYRVFDTILNCLEPQEAESRALSDTHDSN